MRSLWILENIEESHHQPEFITIPFWLRRFKTEIEETHYQPESVIVGHVALFQDGIYIKYRHLATCYNTELMGLDKHTLLTGINKNVICLLFQMEVMDLEFEETY